MSGGGDGAELRLRGGLAALVVVAFGILLWPPLAAPVDGSVDSAWRWGLATSSARGLDPAWIPYGPLGAWLEPRAVAEGDLAGAAAARSVAYLAVLGGLAAWAARRPSPGLWIAAGSIAAATTLVAGHWPDHGLVVAMVALLAPAFDPELRAGTGARWRPLVAGLVAGLAPFLKLTVAVGAAGVAAGFALVLVSGWTRWPRRAGLWGVAGALAGLGAAATLAPGELGATLAWLSAVPAIASVYPEAMALPGTGRSMLALAGPLGVAAVVAAFDGARRSPARGLWAIAVLPLLAAVRHGAVRPDVHALAAAAVAVPLLVLASLVAANAARRRVGLVAALLALATAAPHAASLGLLERGQTRSVASAWLRLDGLRSTVRPERTRTDVLAAGTRRLDAEVDPELTALLDDPRGVDVVPWRIQALEALGLGAAWRPSPTLLLPLAAAPRLDREAARHFGSDRAPGRLLVHLDRLEGRPPLWESPLAWRAIRRRYRVVERHGRWRVAARLDEAREETRRALGEGTLPWGEWAPIPTAVVGEAVRVEIELRPTLGGRLRRALFRAEPVWLDLPGRPIRRLRLLPELAGAGIDLTPPGATLGELDAWFDGIPAARADRLRLRSDDAGRYRPVRVRWWAVRLDERAPSGFVAERLDRTLGEGADAGAEAGQGGE